MKGRIMFIVVWLIAALVATYGLTQVETNFTKEFFIPPGTPTEDYLNMFIKYYDIGVFPRFFIEG